jgi:hypothetical protein
MKRRTYPPFFAMLVKLLPGGLVDNAKHYQQRRSSKISNRPIDKRKDGVLPSFLIYYLDLLTLITLE